MAGDNGYGYEARISKSFMNHGKLGLWYGLNASVLPSVKIWEYSGVHYNDKFHGTTIDIYENEKAYFVGIPISINYAFATARVAPYVSFTNRLDLKLKEDVSPRDSSAFHACSGVAPKACLEKSDFSPVGKLNPVILKSELSVGLAVKMFQETILLDFGVQLDATPRRQASAGERTRTPAIQSSLGVMF